MLKKLIITSLVVFCGSSVHAGLVVHDFGQGATTSPLGGYNMSDFVLGSSTSTNSGKDLELVGTIDGDTTEITLKSSSAISEGTANNVSWWQNAETSDYDIFTVSNSHYIDIFLPDDTVAFSFNVGANISANGWFTAIDNNGLGLTNNVGSNGRHDFSLSATNTPGYGIYADQSNANECTTIASIRVDPSLIWGIGNFSANTGGCASVPEPSILALMGLGLVGIGFARRRRQS